MAEASTSGICEYQDQDIEIYLSNQGRDKIRLKGYTFRVTSKTQKTVYWCCDQMSSRELLSIFSFLIFDSISISFYEFKMDVLSNFRQH